MATFAKSTFSHASYAAFRPSYPPSLYKIILSYHRGPKNLCVDLGCGHGVVARSLSKEFKQVIGTDPSQGMIAQAQSSTPSSEYPNIEYREAKAEELPFFNGNSVDMVVAGQAAHWFDYPRLFPEMRRVLRQGGTLAFWGYKDCVLVNFPKATKILHDYAWSQDKEKLGSYWSQPGRSIVEGKLREIKPPPEEWEDITRVEYEPGTNGPKTGEGTMFINKRMTIGECMDYIRTWSSYHGWQETQPDAKKKSEGGKGDVVDKMFEEMAAAEESLGRNETEIEVEWGSGLLMARKK